MSTMDSFSGNELETYREIPTLADDDGPEYCWRCSDEPAVRLEANEWVCDGCAQSATSGATTEVVSDSTTDHLREV
jgi:ribosomal protein L37AE/L43A